MRTPDHIHVRPVNRLLLLLPFAVFTPVFLQFVTSVNGVNLHEALHRGVESMVDPARAWPFWLGLVLFNLALVAYIRPLDQSWCSMASCSFMGPMAARKALRHLDHLGQFIIFLSVLFFISINLGRVELGPQAHFFPSPRIYTLLESTATGLLAGVMIWLVADNILFVARRNLLGTFPDLQPRHASLYVKILVIFVAVTVFLVFQIFASSGYFFRRGMDMPAVSPRPGDLASMGNDPFDALLDDQAAQHLRDPMIVFYVRIGAYLFMILQLLVEIRKMINRPIRIIHKRLTALNAQDSGDSNEILVVNNDEFAPVFREINKLIARQKSELQVSRERLDSITESAPDPIIVYDGEGRILRCNPAAVAYFNIDAEQAIGRPITELIHLDRPELLLGNGDTGEAACFKSQSLSRMSAVVADGRVRNFEANASRVDCGSSTEFTVVLRDIEAHLELENSLIKARQAAEDANHMKSEFLATMSHELRTPLNAVLGFTQLLSSDRNLTASQLEKIQTINRSGEHLLALINDILDISKIEAGKVELHPVVFDLPQFVQDIQEMFALRCKKKGLSLYVENVGDLPRYVEGDLGKLRQVVINLVGNAVKFTKEGGIGIAVGREDGLFRFSISDSGRGIPREELEQIMRPFVQSSLTDNEGGTGLGLAISSRFVAMMGGSLNVQSEVGKGSVFSFTVALKPTQQVPQALEAEIFPVAVRSGAEHPILVVDDKASNRLVLKEMLEAVGFVTMEAADGREAVALTREIKPLVVLMDIRMPEMDGYQAVTAIKSDPELAGTRVFALTASAFRHDEEAILAAGFDGFLAKPFKRSALFALLKATSGIELVYESAPAPATGSTPDLDSFDWPALAAALAPDLRAALGEAVLINDFTAIQRLAQGIEAHSPALAAALTWYAGAFDEDALATILQRLEKAR